MYTEEERAKWRQLVARWKAGEKVFDAGKRVEKTDATTVQRQEPVQPIKRNFIAEAQRKHAAEAVGPDTRSSYQRKQAQAAKQYANQQYQKAKDDAKRAEGLEQMMKTMSPSTYVEAATGQDLGTVGRLITDAAAFGSPSLIKQGFNFASKQYGKYAVRNMLKRSIDDNGIITAYNRNPAIKDIGSLQMYQEYLNTVFPNSKLAGVQWHMGPKNLEMLKPSDGSVSNTNPFARGIYTSPEKSYPEAIRKFTTMRLEKPSILTTMRRNVFGGWNKANEKYTDVYPVLVNTENPMHTRGIWTFGIGDTKASNIFSQYDGIINSGPRWYQNANSMPETIVPNSNQVLILGSQSDKNQFAGFANKLNRRRVVRDGYVYKNNAVTPDPYKYYGKKPNYSNPDADNLSDYQLDGMLGDYIGRGAERTVYQDLRNSNRVLKITDGGSPDVQITNQDDLLDYIDESLRINNLPEVPRLSYEGFIKDEDRYLPVFSQQKVIPLKKVADPFQIFTRQYTFPNGKTPSGKLSAIRRMNPDALSRIGYKPIPTKPGVYSVNGIGGTYNVTDLGQKNIGIDALGNLKIFDPLFE